MALFGSANSYLGLDIGTSSLKIVELLDRKKRIEVSTYAQANLPNLLMDINGGDDAVRQTANIINQMLDKAGVSTDNVVAALPSNVVFSTVLELPEIPAEEMAEAVKFAARDVVPADLDDIVIGWGRVGEAPHMGDEQEAKDDEEDKEAKKTNTQTVPIFLTAAPKDVVARYTKVMELLKLELVALEVETFPLVRSLLENPTDSAMIVDIGDKVTTYHLIDSGAPRLSHSIEYGGHDITNAIAEKLGISLEKAQEEKFKFGLTKNSPEELQLTINNATSKIIEQAQQLLNIHQNKTGRAIKKTVLIGGGAKLKGIAESWSEIVKHKALIGNPWRGLSYPRQLEDRVKELAPTYAVAIGLAQRDFDKV